MVGSCIFGKFVSMSDTRFFRGSLILRMGDFWYFTGNNCFDLKDWFNLLGIYFCDFQKAVIIAILTDYKQVFWYLNFANHKTKESFVSTANKPLVGTLMTIDDVTVSNRYWKTIGHKITHGDSTVWAPLVKRSGKQGLFIEICFTNVLEIITSNRRRAPKLPKRGVIFLNLYGTFSVRNVTLTYLPHLPPTCTIT